MSNLFDNANTIDSLLNVAGIGDRLLGKWGDVLSLMQHLDAADLTRLQRDRLRAAFKLRCVAEAKTQIRAPADSYYNLQHLAAEPQEHFVVMVLDTRNRVRETVTIYVGSVNQSVIRVAEVLRPAIVNNCPSIILAHNHPSGDPEPSPEDISVTRAIIQGAKILDIEILDHVVIGAGKFVSLKERGLAFGGLT
jgi:DNA repair protein RadC